MRRAPPLDMSTVERRGHPLAVRETNKRVRPHGLQEAPTFRPTEEEFKDPMAYMRKIAPEGRKYGICKIIPPDSWNPSFAIDTEKFHFRTRRQELNSVEGSTRANLNYLDQLAKFHKQHGMNLNRFPSVDKRPLDLYKLKKAVETRGGFERVCKLKKWAEIGRDLGYSGKIMSSLSTSLKNSYQKWLHPYEEYLRVAKPGVQQQLEFEYGGPLTPSPANSPMKRSHQHTPSSLRGDSPAIRASVTLNSQLKYSEEADKPPPPTELPRPITSSGFTAVNSGGFTPVNLTPASFQAVNTINSTLKWEATNGTSTSQHSEESVVNTNKNTPEYQTSTLSAYPHTNGHTSNPLKRTISHESLNGGYSGNDSTPPGEVEGQNGRRSKRQRKGSSLHISQAIANNHSVAAISNEKGHVIYTNNRAEAAPTVVGSHMSLLRPLVPRMSTERRKGKPGELCETCGQGEVLAPLVVCDSCDCGYHQSCLDHPIKSISHDWHCPRCLVGTGEFGFEEGGIYGLRQFQDKAFNFKESYFGPKMPFDPVLNCKRNVTEDDVEREFWRLVESITETVEVEYGADIHSTTHGSGFPDIEKHPQDPYCKDPWNLNILPLHAESLFRHIKSDISGMTVPWLYVGMCFSTFCWHNEDHYTYSANYQHFGATKTWYGIPGADADRFEQAMKQAVPELFEQQPDLLFQLVTLLPPDQLKKAGVNVYALDQRAGQFVVTFPQAYHAGFNHGFNFNEAVNFAPNDWEPFGEAGVKRLQEFRRQPCFSHDELLMTAASRDTTIKTAKWLAPALERLRDRELQQRQDFLKRHMDYNDHYCKVVDEPGAQSSVRCAMGFETDDDDLPEEDYQCSFCKAFSYLSRYQCHKSGKVMCLLHAGTYECCNVGEEQRHTSAEHTLRYRHSEEGLKGIVQKVIDRANMPQAWKEKLDKVLEDEEKPSLKVMRSLVSEGERIPYELPDLPALKQFVDRCNEWVEEATNYITRKQQNRRKNERVWRKGNSAKAAEMEERDKELRKVDNIHKLLDEADRISFDCPEITTLRERSEAIATFRNDARTALNNLGLRSTQEYEDLAEMGKGFNVDVPEVEELERVVKQMKWNDQAREMRTQLQTLSGVDMFIKQGHELGIPETNEHLVHYQEQKAQGELWESKANELIRAEIVHYQQLEALSSQASSLPVSRDTLLAIDAILTKQREAHKQIISMYEKSKDPDFKRRPKYKAVRDILDSLSELNSKPAGTIDLEKEIKRHEDWMRKGKKLFGKANAPLHILHSHMMLVRDHNEYCLDLQDKPRMPVEPASREQTPMEDETSQGIKSTRDVFCICRQPEAGMMIECELCHEWYHGKCLKIARGKIKEDDKYTCPICDYRVKIPRDAARPKLEDLQDWQAELPSLPFQPDEEDTLEDIVSSAQEFRDFIRPYTNPVMTTPDEVTTQRFYLRKIEGADILLAFETNFFRQELHKWAPVAPEPPPILENSLSTRKPRPTKQMKMMAQLGIDNPEDLPQQFKAKQYHFKSRKSSDAQSTKAPQPLQPAPQFARGPDTPGSLSHSASTGATVSSRGNSQRLPQPISTAHPDSAYSAYFPTMSPQSGQPHGDFGNPSPPFTWQNRPPHPNQSPALVNSPIFRPSTPSQGPGPPLDPGLFSPSTHHFAASALRVVTAAPSPGSLVSPLRDTYGPDPSNSGTNMDSIFADFTTDADDQSRNEAGEALEGLGVVGGSQEGDEGQPIMDDL
ncbi:hypothetical protein MMC11_002027 [Xylographa trunciseda]|nr:hypothetical protein [Xylographa trunciseda]